MEHRNAETEFKIDISDEVISICAVNATLKTTGVYELAGGITDSISKNVLGKESSSKGIKISRTENRVEIDVFVIIDYQVKIPVVAWDIQDNVKKEVETMTGLTVKAVNIHVQGVHIDDIQEM